MVQPNFAADMHIEESALDIEWLEQPSKMMAYIRFFADAAKHLEKSKDKLKIIQAKLDMDVRKSPGEFGIEKVTEAAIQSIITLSPECIAAREEIIKAQYEYDMTRGAVQAMAQRKDALENMVRLNGQAYFAGPSMPRDLSKERKNRQRELEDDANVSIKMKRGKTSNE